MSGIKRFLTGVTETRDHAPEPDLRTRYYRGRSGELTEKLGRLSEKETAFRTVHVDRERGEVMLEYRNPLGIRHDVVVTVVALSPVRMAVDIHAAIRGKFPDFGWNRTLIRRIYQYIDTEGFQRDKEKGETR